MREWLEKLIARLWNRRSARRSGSSNGHVLDVGAQIVDGEPVRKRVGIDQSRRAESIAILGKTGTGKSSLIRHLAEQDINAGRGFAFFDLHGDATEFLVATIAGCERMSRKDLSDRLIVIDPADPACSIGLNPLAAPSPDDRFVQIAEFAQILKQRWHLESFGARTDELLRNCLFALSESGLTLVELGPLLGNAAFRASCVAKLSNAEIRQYFESRYDQASDAMRVVLAEPVLNKTSSFVADARFRHIVGQQHSTFSLVEAMDQGYWIILNLNKGRLGEQAATLGSLFLAKIKHALFGRRSRKLFTLYCDEIQNLVAFGAGLETILAEARKFGSGVVSANQFLDQYPPDVRAAILAVGSLVCFQLSGPDAQQIAGALDGGKALAELLKNLPRRHAVVKSVHERWREAVVPTVQEPTADPSDLYRRSRARWARTRRDIEEEIRRRQAGRNNREALHDWE